MSTKKDDKKELSTEERLSALELKVELLTRAVLEGGGHDELRALVHDGDK